MTGPMKSGSTGPTQKYPTTQAAAAAGAAKVKGGAATVAAGPKAGPRDLKSGSKGG